VCSKKTLIRIIFTIGILLGQTLLCWGGSKELWAPVPDVPATRVTNSLDQVDHARRDDVVSPRVAGVTQVGLEMMGNSIEHYWEGDPSWAAFSQGRNVLNVAVSGEVTPGMLHSLLVRGWIRLPKGLTPKVIMVLAGTNNCHRSGFSGLTGPDTPPQEVADGIRAIVQVYARSYPTARIIHLGIFPTTWHPLWKPVNALTANYYDNKQVFSRNLGDLFLSPDGSVNLKLLPDGIHPNTAGYTAWSNALKPLIDSLMKATPLEPVAIMNIGGSITEGASAKTAYRRYLDGLLRQAGRSIDFVGSQTKHDQGRFDPAAHYMDSPEYYQYDFDHEGQAGKTTAWMADNMGKLARKNVPKIAVLHMGTEDLLTGTGAMADIIAKAVANVDRTIDSLRVVNDHVKIVLAEIIPINSPLLANPATAVQDFNARLAVLIRAKTSKTSPVVAVDQYKGFDVKADLQDGVLPSESGAVKMAGKFFTAIDALIDGRGCQDSAYLEFDPSATRSDKNLCLTPFHTTLVQGTLRPVPFAGTAMPMGVYDIRGAHLDWLRSWSIPESPHGLVNGGRNFKSELLAPN
jgi:acyl-CoA thioesterase-1